MEVKESGKEKRKGCCAHNDLDEPIASYLEELLLENLCLTFQSVIEEISETGYDEAAVEKSILRRGLYIGSKTPVLTLVSDTLDHLKGREEVDSLTEGKYDGVKQLAEYTLLEMTSVLREIRPFLTAGEAMWWLLICDLNVLQACRLEEDSSSGLRCSGFSESESVLSQLRGEAHNHVTDSVAFGEFLRRNKPKNSEVTNEDLSLAATLKNLDNFLSTGEENGKTGSQASASGQNSGAGRKGQCKRERTRHLSKSYCCGRTCSFHGSKGLLESGKLGNVGDIAIKIKQNSSSRTPSASPKTSSSKTNAGLGGKGTSALCNASPETDNLSTLLGKAKTSTLPTAATKPLQKCPDVKPGSKSLVNPTGPRDFSDYYAGIPYDKSTGKYLPQDEKDEAILKLVHRLRGLQNELRGWTEWANQKVMQAARKLSKVQPELKTMRQLTEATKKFIQENSTQRLTIMKNSVNGMDSLVERGRSIICRLKEKNSLLKEELEFAKSMALESAASFQEALDREQKAQKEVQSWDGQNDLLYKELETEKSNLAALQHEIGKAKNKHLKVEARLERERKETAKLLAEADLVKKEREQLEVQAKAEVDNIKFEALTASQKSMEDIVKLERRFSEAMLKSKSSRMAALKWGGTESFGKHLMEAKSFVTMMQFQNFKDCFGTEGLRQERECVMCLSEEISVVFVPCSHQVLCEKCNELHEKRGMEDCPSCRTPIQRRIKVRFVKP